MLSMAAVTLTDQNFKQEVLENKLPVLVDFWATWCPPCKMIEPIMHELAEEYKGKVVVGKIDADENPTIAGQFSVMSLPTILVFKNGQPVKTLVGAQGKQTFKQAIDEVLAS